MYLRICGTSKSANSRKIYGSQIRNMPHLRKIHKSNKKHLSASNLRICKLQDLFADRSPLPGIFHLFVGLDTVPF